VQALRTVGAVGADVADEIQADLGLAVAGRYRLSIYGVGRPGSAATPRRASCQVVPVAQAIKFRNDDLRSLRARTVHRGRQALPPVRRSR
jgi:hypothetical protein